MTTSDQLLSRSGNRTATLGLSIAIASALAFGATGPFAKSLIDAGWSPETVVLVRIAGAALVLTPFAVRAWLGVREQLGADDGRAMLAYGIVAVAGVQLCFFNAVDRLPVSIALLIEYLAPVLLVIGSSVRTRSLPPRLVAIGAVIATIGLVPVLNLQVNGGLDPIGVAWALAAALCLSTYFVLTARSNSHLPQTLLIWAGCVVGSAVVGLTGLTGVMHLDRGAASVILAGQSFSWIVSALFLIVVATVVAYLSGMVAIRMLGNRRASFIALTEVLFAAIASWLLLGETLSPFQAMGAALVITGVIMVQRGAAAPDEMVSGPPLPERRAEPEPIASA